jgi:hypothetical protein
LQDRAFVLNSGAFKDMVARIRHGLLRRLFWLHFMMLFVCFCDDTICLMAEPCCEFTVLLQDFFRRMDFLAVACAMSCYFCCARALSSNLM